MAFRGKLPLCSATGRNQIGFGVNAAKGNSFYLKVFGGERESKKNNRFWSLQFFTVLQNGCHISLYLSSTQVVMTKQYSVVEMNNRIETKFPSQEWFFNNSRKTVGVM